MVLFVQLAQQNDANVLCTLGLSSSSSYWWPPALNWNAVLFCLGGRHLGAHDTYQTRPSLWKVHLTNWLKDKWDRPKFYSSLWKLLWFISVCDARRLWTLRFGRWPFNCSNLRPNADLVCRNEWGMECPLGTRQVFLANENQEQVISSDCKVFGEFLAPTHTACSLSSLVPCVRRKWEEEGKKLHFD